MNKREIEALKPRRFFWAIVFLTLLLALITSFMSCSPKGTLNCGSTYKLIAPKFTK